MGVSHIPASASCHCLAHDFLLVQLQSHSLSASLSFPLLGPHTSSIEISPLIWVSGSVKWWPDLYDLTVCSLQFVFSRFSIPSLWKMALRPKGTLLGLAVYGVSS